MVKVMKKRKAIIVGLFILMGILFNITVYFDNGGVQDNDFALSDLRVSLVNRAYASGGGNTIGIMCCPYPYMYCPGLGYDWDYAQ